jgi:hypothetical protein
MKRIFATLMMLLVGAPVLASPLEAVQRDIAQARERSPEMFAHVEQLRAQLLAAPPPYERRGQVVRQMKALGPDALLPLLQLITEQRGLDTVAQRTREMVLVGAIEAVGELKDLRAQGVMRAILDGPEANAQIARAAAEALGQLESDDAVAWLAAHAVAGDRRERAAIAGLAFARKPVAVAALRARLATHPDSGTVEKLADAMGFNGSSWAWQALGPARADEGLALRGELSNELVAAYARYDGRAREAIGRALLMIDHPSAPNRLSALSASANATLAADLQALQQRWLRLR